MPVTNLFIYRGLWGVFLLIPAILLLLRERKNPKLSMWILVLVSALASWACVFGATHFYFEHLHDLNDATGWQNEELVRRWSADGGPMVFGLCFGWLYGLIYLLPWLLLIVVARWVGRRAGITKRQTRTEDREMS